MARARSRNLEFILLRSSVFERGCVQSFGREEASASSSSSCFPGQPSGLVAAAGGLGAEGSPRLAALHHAAGAARTAGAVLQLGGARGGGGEGRVAARHGRTHELVDGVGADDAAAVARPLRRREVPARVAADRTRA